MEKLLYPPTSDVRYADTLTDDELLIEEAKYIPIWHAVLDEQTCDECRCLHEKPLFGIGIRPPLHGLNDDRRGRKPCRCTIRWVKRSEFDSEKGGE